MTKKDTLYSNTLLTSIRNSTNLVQKKHFLFKETVFWTALNLTSSPSKMIEAVVNSIVSRGLFMIQLKELVYAKTVRYLPKNNISVSIQVNMTSGVFVRIALILLNQLGNVLRVNFHIFRLYSGNAGH